MRGLRDFVPGGYPLPWNPVTLGEYIPGRGENRSPIAMIASAHGGLPKSPDLPMSAINHGKGVGCCSDCGMGAFPTWLGPADTIIPQSSLPTMLQGDAYVSGVATVYLALGGLALAAMFMGKKR